VKNAISKTTTTTTHLKNTLRRLILGIAITTGVLIAEPSDAAACSICPLQGPPIVSGKTLPSGISFVPLPGSSKNELFGPDGSPLKGTTENRDNGRIVFIPEQPLPDGMYRLKTDGRCDPASDVSFSIGSLASLAPPRTTGKLTVTQTYEEAASNPTSCDNTEDFAVARVTLALSDDIKPWLPIIRVDVRIKEPSSPDENTFSLDPQEFHTGSRTLAFPARCSGDTNDKKSGHYNVSYTGVRLDTNEPMESTSIAFDLDCETAAASSSGCSTAQASRRVSGQNILAFAFSFPFAMILFLARRRIRR